MNTRLTFKTILIIAFIANYTTSYAQDQELISDCTMFPTLNAGNNPVDTIYIDDIPYTMMLLPNLETNTIDTVYKSTIVDEYDKLPERELALRKYLAEHCQYPNAAKDSSITGSVCVQFVINEKGKIENVNLIKSAHPVLDAEAMRVVRSIPEWEPGKIQGRPVKVLYTIPINFQLN